MVRATRVGPNEISRAQDALDDNERRFNERNEALFKYFGEQECYLCMGSEGPVSPDNSELLICGHTVHVMCQMRARQTVFHDLSNAFQILSGGNGDLNRGMAHSPVVHGLACGMCRSRIVPYGAVSPPVCRAIDQTRLQDVKPPLQRLPALERIVSHRIGELQKREKVYGLMRSILDKTYKEHLPPEEGGPVRAQGEGGCMVQ